MAELPVIPKAKLDEWFRSIEYKVIHYWKNFHSDCFYIVCGCSDGVGYDLFFIRIFKVGDKWELSEDHKEST
jgi:hypothetical protein